MNPLDSLTTAGTNQPLIEALEELNDFCKDRNSRWYSFKQINTIYLNIFDDGSFAATDEKIESFRESSCNSFEEFVIGISDSQYDYTFYELDRYDIKVLFDKYKDLLV